MLFNLPVFYCDQFSALNHQILITVLDNYNFEFSISNLIEIKSQKRRLFGMESDQWSKLFVFGLNKVILW